MLRFLCDRSRHRAGWRFLRFTTIVTVKKSAGAEKRLDNSPSMPYNNHCCAGVAHLVERDLAKVEVASSSLVARSKKKHHPSGWCFFWSSRAEARKGTSAARKTCRWHVLVSVCVWRPGRAASEPRRPLQKTSPINGGVFFRRVKNASQSLPPAGGKKSKSFFTATCAWGKIPLRLQVWNFAACGKIMRAAGCKPFVGKTRRVFRQSHHRPSGRCFFALISPPAGC